MLRVQLENALPSSPILIVSSARKQDGKTATSAALAKSFVAAGYKTLHVTVDSHPDVATLDVPSLASAAEVGLRSVTCWNAESGADTMALSTYTLGKCSSRDSSAAFVAACRNEYGFTVIDGACVVEDNLTLLLALAADGLLISVRRGRRPHRTDRELVNLMEREKVKMVGVVSVSRAVIETMSPRLQQSVTMPVAEAVPNQPALNQQTVRGTR